MDKPSEANVAGEIINSVYNEETGDTARSCAKPVLSLGMKNVDLVALRIHIQKLHAM